MAISNIVCRGYGSFGGGVNKLPTRGYGIAAPPVFTTVNSLFGLVGLKPYLSGKIGMSPLLGGLSGLKESQQGLAGME